MPSLAKMPGAARSLVSSVWGIFHHGHHRHDSNLDKVKQFSTPQVDRKNKVSNGTRRSSDTPMQANGVSKRIFVPNIESWEPGVMEKELLRRTWSDDFEFLYELGSSIYFYIFEHNPNCKKLFPYLAKYGDNWKDSKEFRSQALKFVQSLSQVVKNLYHMERLEPYLYEIGQRHVKFADRGFKAEYWDDFQDAMEHSLAAHMSTVPDLDEEQRIEAVRVWRTLALYTIAHMKRGFFDGLKGVNVFPPLLQT